MRDGSKAHEIRGTETTSTGWSEGAVPRQRCCSGLSGLRSGTNAGDAQRCCRDFVLFRALRPSRCILTVATRQGVAWLSMARPGVAWQGLAGQGEARLGMAGFGMAGLGEARRGMAWQGEAWMKGPSSDGLF